MKLSIFALSAFVVGASANMADVRSGRRLNQEFMTAMHGNSKIKKVQKSRAEKIQQLHENLMKSSRKLEYSSYSNYNGQQQQNNGEQQQDDGQQYQQQYEQGQAYADQGEWNGNYWEFEGDVPFDLSAKAFKYAGCAAINVNTDYQANDDQNQDENQDENQDQDQNQDNTYDQNSANGEVVETHAVFRLCPADKCNKYSLTGCGSNYGEYAVELKTYLGYVLNFYDERYEQYCGFCAPCDWEYQAEAKTVLQECYQMVEQQEYYEAQQTQQEAWQNYYNANGGDMSGWNVNSGNGNGDQSFQSYNQYYNNAADYNNQYSNNYNSNGGNRKLEEGGDADEDGDYNNGQYYNNNADYNQDGDQANGYWGADGVYYEYEEVAEEEYICADGASCDMCQYQTEQTYFQCDDYICGDYYTYCSDLYGELDAEFDVLDFLECQEYESDYGQYYIGPHCGSDSYTISLGVFSDASCSNYVGESVSLASVLGFNYDDSDIFKLPTECISCDSAEDYEEQQEEETEQNQGRYGQYVTAPETDQDGVLAVCRALYEGSTQCNMHMSNFESIAQYMSDYELEVESENCAFVENVVPETPFDMSDWRNIEQYKKLKMSAGSVIGIALVCILAVSAVAAVIVKARSTNGAFNPWRPKRSVYMNDEDLSREGSGIGLARSRSGTGAGSSPLI